MQLSLFYQLVGGSYEEVKNRLITDERILKYLKKFPGTDDYENLRGALERENWQEAFRFSHNLKGVCLNLGLQSLFAPASTLCENLRGGTPLRTCAPMMSALTEKYTETLSAIARL